MRALPHRDGRSACLLERVARPMDKDQVVYFAGLVVIVVSAVLWLLPMLVPTVLAQVEVYPHNSVSCARCHSEPSKFGASSMRVQRKGRSLQGIFFPFAEGGIHHRDGESAQDPAVGKEIKSDRVSVNLLGDGYLEAMNDRDVEQNALTQRQAAQGIGGVIVLAPVLETSGSSTVMQAGKFGWKNQHTSLLSSCADSLRNELGVRNRLYPDEYSTHNAADHPTPFDTPDPKTGKTELDRLVDEIRRMAPPARDQAMASTGAAQAGEKVFAETGCAICHVPTYKTLPPGTRINGGTYKVPKSRGSKVIHPYSDFLLHDVGTGDGIPQAAKPEFLDQSTANKFRTPPLWGLRFRTRNLMHDGDTPSPEAAIKRHAGEATRIRNRYEQLSPEQKQQLLTFLSSL